MSSTVTEIQKTFSIPSINDQGAKDDRDETIREIAKNALVVRLLSFSSLLEWTWSIILQIDHLIFSFFREIFIFPDLDDFSSELEQSPDSPRIGLESSVVMEPKAEYDSRTMPPRLYNIGNTCYFNSVLQLVLSSGNFLTELLTKAQIPQPGDSQKVYERRMEIFRLLQEFHEVIKKGDRDEIEKILQDTYKSFLESGLFQDLRMGGRHNQEDAHSFLGYLFEVLGMHFTYNQTLTKPRIHNSDYDNKKIESPILDDDKEVTTQPQLSFTINIPMDSKEFNFQVLFDKEFEPEEVLDCGLKGVFKEKHIAEPLPEVLFVVLQRFQHDKISGVQNKIEAPVKFPAENILDLSKAVGKASPVPYQLIGLSSHSGGMGGGHYTSDVLKNGLWYRTNDSQVEPISADAINTQKAYLFAFKRLEIVEPLKERQSRTHSV